MGQEGMGIVHAGASSMHAGNFISEHDRLISEKLGRHVCEDLVPAPKSAKTTCSASNAGLSRTLHRAQDPGAHAEPHPKGQILRN